MDINKIILPRERYSEAKDIIAWCNDNIGEGDPWNDKIFKPNKWCCRIDFGYQHFQFIDERDALMFALRWT